NRARPSGSTRGGRCRSADAGRIAETAAVAQIRKELYTIKITDYDDAMLKTALGVVSLLVLLAIGYLTASVAILRPPRLNYAMWLSVATVVGAQILVTFGALAWAAFVPFLRYAAMAGALVVGVIGARMLRDTLAGAHFEGYALVLGAMLVVQA